MPNKSYSFKHIGLVMEGPVRYNGKVKNPKDAATFFKKRIGNNVHESFIGLYLDIKSIPLGWREISRGTVNATLPHPRDTFMPAVKLGAVAVIVCHNHPFGDPTPSRADISVTRQLTEAGHILEIELLDHLIVTRSGFVSMKEEAGYVFAVRKQDWET